ncbi:MAG: cyclic nucleotide-binding domain-containing protein [Bacteroidales bacterium]
MSKRKKIVVVFILIQLVFVSTIFANNDLPSAINEPTAKFMFWAFLLGGLSAVSLVIGSVLGLVWKPSPRITAAFTAFGAGALLAALSVELIAPTVIEFVESNHTPAGETAGHEMFLEFAFLIVGCVIGGILFYFLNEALNSKGGYLRKASTTISYFNHMRNKRFRLALKRFSKINLFRSVPATHLDILVQHIRHVNFKKGSYLFHKGNITNHIYFIESGEVNLVFSPHQNRLIKDNEIVGETAFLVHDPILFDAVAATDIKAFELSRNDFEHLKDACPELQEIIGLSAKNELMKDMEFLNSEPIDSAADEEWISEALKHTHHYSYIPTQREINEHAQKQPSAPLSIWLGIFLDGIPESFVIGAGFLIILATKGSLESLSFTSVIPYTLIAGLFLSNLPEAMSSSIGMKKMGWNSFKILSLWSSLMIMTAIGAIFGYYYGAIIPNYVEIGIEGIASGAMLTMISQTMIPEAVHIGGNKVTGLSTLAGYLSAVAFKIFE